MLGTFTVGYKGRVILTDEGRTRKVWNLFAYLIANHSRQLAATELPELLCSDERSDEPAKAVKNLVYRLRCMISDSDLPEADYIVQKGGIYGWNPEIDLEIDCEAFEEKFRAARREIDNDTLAEQYYFDAIEYYKGGFLPRFRYEEWTVTPSTQYHRDYINCIKSLFELLSRRGHYEKMIPICEEAISYDQYDEEVYRIYIECLIHMNKQKEALKAYDTITERLYQEMGVNPSKELKQLYRSILKSIKSVETDIMIIKEDLNEQGNIDGTYCCEYEIFKDIYRFAARGVERTGTSIFIMLCTITDQRDQIPSVEHLRTAMDKLREVILGALRKGDLFAQYSSTQYVIMLPGTSYENGVMVGNRITSAFKRQSSSRYAKLHFKLQPLDPKIG